MSRSNNHDKVLEPISVNRRRFMKALGVGGLGLSGAIQKVYGKEPDGRPIVWTRNIYGEPERVRVIPKERYRRLKVYERLNPNSIIEHHPIVDEISIEQQSNDEEDLAIKLLLNDNSTRKLNRLPNEIHDVR